MKITYVYADFLRTANSSEWRCVIPSRAINRLGRHWTCLLGTDFFQKNTAEAQAACENADVIIVERNLFGDTLTAVQHWKARGKVVIVDFDDAYHLMHSSNPAYDFWHKGKMPFSVPDSQWIQSGKMNPVPITQFKWGLKMVDAAIMPSKKLAEDWDNYVDTYYVPNYLELENYLNVPAVPHEGVLLGWGGSVSHLQSFTESGLGAALKKVLKARPQTKLIICGNQDVFKSIDLPQDRKIFQDFVPFNQWPKVMAWFDIGLAPLQGAYDDRRSWIKPLEYSVMKIPWVASASVAYDEIGPYGKCVANSINAWEETLLDMIDHLEEYREKAGGAAYQFALKQSSDNNIEKILEIYAKIIEKSTGRAIN